MRSIVVILTLILVISRVNAETEALKTIEGTSHESPNNIRLLKKAQKIFKKKLQKRCGYNAAYFAQLHTQDEWEAIQQAGKFADETNKICPKVKIKDKHVQHVYDFAYEYAKDSGNIPSY
jgi:phosphoribosylaminoimidazole carboxylase (NCAIR synthetase)